ncbi:hypothetical protein CTI12_AA060570 [Artemisia annua]|uniref:K+ potassium transporter C-terminal domain-containing protein n=1 Tax=Artemisia annua TaxID=35608 RepID=A0A2U1Q949_ARTAN|nr:hypothetical protein CTI12_AA060570 [Artemisia annua]
MYPVMIFPVVVLVKPDLKLNHMIAGSETHSLPVYTDLKPNHIISCLLKQPHIHTGLMKQKQEHRLYQKIITERRVLGIGLVFNDLTSGIPVNFSLFVTNLLAFHQILVFVYVKSVPVPFVPPTERYLLGRVECLLGCIGVLSVMGIEVYIRMWTRLRLILFEGFRTLFTMISVAHKQIVLKVTRITLEIAQQYGKTKIHEVPMNVTFEELLKARSDGSHAINQKPKVELKGKRENRIRPTDISTKNPVGRFKEIIQAPKKPIYCSSDKCLTYCELQQMDHQGMIGLKLLHLSSNASKSGKAKFDPKYVCELGKSDGIHSSDLIANKN